MILCVDDEPHNLDLLDRALRRHFEVITEAIPEAALAVLDGNPAIAAILCDFRMPAMTGVDLLDQAAVRRPDVRRLLVTGYGDADPVTTGLASGGIQCIVHKPWRAQELLALVSELVRGREIDLENVRLAAELAAAHERLRIAALPDVPSAPPADRFRVAPSAVEVAATDRFRPYHERMSEVIAILQRDRAVSCLYVDLSQLDRISLEHGVATHAELFDQAGAVLDGLRGQLLRSRDVICRSNDDESYICLLSPRDASQVDLDRLTAAVGEAVASGLASKVRELLRDEPRVNVGAARVLSNPMVRPERLVARLVAEAHDAAKLSRQRAAQRDKAVLQDIILGDGLTSVYQPIVHIETGEIFGHEALTRGPRGTRMESPATLFAVADEVDLTFELDRACFRGALRRAVGLEPIHRLFVNLLPMSFYDASFIEIEVSHLLSAAALTPANIVFEISERLAIENFAAFRRALAIYTNMGFGVAIDDVGTRHSNLETVMALRPHFIKLSDVLSRGVARSTVKREMLRSLGHIAETIDAVMVAEGIETLDDLIALRELGIRYGQGFYMARPGPPFPRVRGSVRRSILAIGSRHLEPIVDSRATGMDPDLDGDDDVDGDGDEREVTGEVRDFADVAGVARGSGEFVISGRLSGAALGPSDRPLADELRALADQEILGEIAPPEPEGHSDEMAHDAPRWRHPRPTPPSTDPRHRPLIESLRRRDDDAPPVPDGAPKPGLN